MMITLDPTEMIAASETLRSCATEAADIGSQLMSCACCPMPAELQSVVDGLVSGVDRALDEVASRLGANAADLTSRAQIAATDSLSAAASSVDTTASPSVNVGNAPLAVSIVLDGQAYAEVDGVLVPVNPGLVETLVGGGPGSFETMAPGTFVTTLIGGGPGSFETVAPGTLVTTMVGGQSLGDTPLGNGTPDIPSDTGFQFGPPPGMVDPYPGLTNIIASLPVGPQRSPMGLINPLVGGPADTPWAVAFHTRDLADAAGMF